MSFLLLSVVTFFFAETLLVRWKKLGILKLLRGKNLQTRAFYPARLSFRIEGEIRNFSDKQRLK